jgi:hypothetical protein
MRRWNECGVLGSIIYDDSEYNLTYPLHQMGFDGH